jgi:hypothetical protein
VKATDKSIVLNGAFLNIDEGKQTSRLLIGFGLGGEKLRTEIQGYQGKLMVAEAQTTTDANLKPTSAVSSSETVSTAEADARRTAKAIVKEIQAAYQRRGWVVKAS